MAAVSISQGAHNYRASPYIRKNLRLNSLRPNRLSMADFNNGDPRAEDDETVTINVSGFRYETRLSTLSRFPGTLLGDPLRRATFYDSVRKEYFFDRNRKIFGSVLEFYQTGILRRPESVPLHRFVSEILFYDLGVKVLKELLEVEEMLDEPPTVPINERQRKIWLMLEVPSSSPTAQALAAINIIIVFIALSNFCIQTLPRYHTNFPAINATGSSSTSSGTNNAGVSGITGPKLFFIVESICSVYFCLDLIVRFIASPMKKHFLLQFTNVIDLVSVIPYFVDLLLPETTLISGTTSLRAEKVDFFLILRVFRLLQIFRILKLSRYSDGLQILWLTAKSARQELSVLFLLTGIGMTLSSAAVYYAEQGYPDSDFPSIPHAFWWTVITWTAVGYGDMVPKRPIGKVVGGICCACGVVCLAFIVPVVVAHFEYYFHRGKEIQKLREVLAAAGYKELADPSFECFTTKEKRSTSISLADIAMSHKEKDGNSSGLLKRRTAINVVDCDTGERTTLETDL
ncbi:LOW QUALITY PROTEIN: potassium voltage-gated channel subfamily A member 2-like [Paramacrobiotus metropolitanus]|uniref:LOW QUALITY PROTEIN: potassium voltage-gated channel subfamily A member 2-like n=1 Tax=Paramacrobiotus metropolitanus TaxID=2943436 RepID=UPI0024462B5D|nr:LOW QUALITY PROTEIN: potassium voltage-gated channel subfamily A member 2-like [Paramacrobiotus metropolitanus]